MTEIQITPKYKDVKPSGFYVYLHRRKSDGLIMHVGKGTGRRGWSKSGRNDHWIRSASKHGCVIEVVSEGMSECCSLTKEKILIAKYRSIGHPLTNMTDGGEGISGYSRPRSDLERGKLRSARGASEVCCSNGMIFNTSKDAAEWVESVRGLKSFPSAINLACIGGIRRAYGYSWWRLGQDEKPVIDGRVVAGINNKKRVVCSDGTSHDSATDAETYLKAEGFHKASSSAVSAACNGRIKSAYGRSWWFEGSAPVEYVPRYIRSAESNRKKYIDNLICECKD